MPLYKTRQNSLNWVDNLLPLAVILPIILGALHVLPVWWTSDVTQLHLVGCLVLTGVVAWRQGRTKGLVITLMFVVLVVLSIKFA